MYMPAIQGQQSQFKLLLKREQEGKLLYDSVTIIIPVLTQTKTCIRVGRNTKKVRVSGKKAACIAVAYRLDGKAWGKS